MGQYDLAYDTICYYILHCYAQADPARTFGTDFGGASRNIQKTHEGNVEARNFLLQALHLRNDDAWFCCDVAVIGGTFDGDDKANMTVLQFLIDNPRCAAFRDQNVFEYNGDRFTDFQNWRQNAKPNDVYDSTLPTMHDLGLDSLLQFAASVKYDVQGPQIILAAGLTPNPGMGEFNVTLNIGREAYIHIEVFDLLGNQLPAGYSGVFEPGTRSVPLDLRTMPAGMYYLRISTANNEVRTMKLVKE